MKKRTIIFGAVMAGTFFTNAMAKNSFGNLGSGSEVRNNLSSYSAELQCGEGKTDSTAAKTMEGKCGDKKATMEAKCGEGKCGDKKATMSKTTEAKCGDKAMAPAKGKKAKKAKKTTM